ncbi:MAG TPA: efflux RND transporter permease subunit, partial [Bryobacteraceae bacterium]|nr:efflux RND transporter permease subunit [Bryobacteraceae bacterium]
VRLALRRPYTFVVMAFAILLVGILAIVRMPADVFPNINIPVISAIWTYSGVSPAEMADVITTRSERGFTTGVNDIEHMESQSLAGLSVIKIFFHPNVKIDAAVAQITAQSQGILTVLPFGVHPPNVIRYNAASVPILQLGLSSDTLSEQQLYDFGYNFLRTQLANTQGASFPLPYGGKPRQIMVDINPQAMYSHGLSASDVSNALNEQSLILPTGSAKIGTREYRVEMNNTPNTPEEFNNLPVKTVNGTTIYLHDVAQVRDGAAVQTNIVRHDGRRGALLTVLKNGDVSTIEIVSQIKAALPRILSSLPKSFHVTTLFDQSIFVRAAINGVVREAIVAAMLTGIMILLFLGSWRSTLIVCISIPLSILTSLAVLYAMGETINIMTLGGMALAVGILVDDATVEIENIHRNLGMGKGVIHAILDGARQIAVPAFVSTLCICIVFVPVSFLSGAARYLFTPLALAVVLAMSASYLLSRTLVPTMIRYLIPAELRLYQGPEGEAETADAGLIWRVHHAFHRGFERMRGAYSDLLTSTLHHRGLVLACFAIVTASCAALYPFIGTDFFPQVDAGQIRLHVRCPGGTRIEETEARFAQVEESIRRIIPPQDLSDVLDNIGLPYSGYNLAFSDSVTLGPADGEILVSLRPGDHRPTWDYVREMRKRLNREFPDLTFFFQPADMVGQILNFGLPAPIDVQVVGPLQNLEKNQNMAAAISKRIEMIPGAADVHVHQVNDVPMMKFDVDRARAGQMGFSQLDVANGLLISLSSSAQLNPNWWVNPANGVDYPVVVQTPTYRMDSPDAILNTPIHSSGGKSTELLSNVAQATRSVTDQVVNHYNVQPLYDVFANVQDRDLGAVAADVDKVLDEFRPKLAPGSFFETRGQVGTMRSSFTGMGYGLLFAIVLVYFVMVVNFQSWVDPFIVLMAVPGALGGILLMLFFSRTTVSVPALMGAIMSIGVGTANSILLVVFANDLRREGADALTAAYQAGRTRLRPVVMTAVAMLVGMIPMALGLGEGGEQNAPLGRAVIGGLLFATAATLFIVPVVYSLLRKTPPKMFDQIEAND